MTDVTRFIHSGVGKIVTIHEGGATGPNLHKARVDEILGGVANAPHDAWFAFDITPIDQNGDKFVPDDPAWSGQPNAPEWGYPVHLKFTYTGDGDASITHEYANFGCTPRIRVTTGPEGSGLLTDIYAVGPLYPSHVVATINIHPGPIYIGRGA